MTASTVSPLLVCDRAATAAALDFASLVDAIAQAAADYASQAIISPERLVLPLGEGGVLLSMPATAADIGIHKLVNVLPGNAALKLPTIHGIVTVCDARTGQPLCLLDGPEVTGRRTAAVSLLAIRTLLPAPPRDVLLLGTGTQALYHLQALHALYPDCRIRVRSRNLASAGAFCQAHGPLHADLQACDAQDVPVSCDVVITLTTATSPVYNEIPRPGRLVIGVGAFKPEMAEIGAQTLNQSVLYADDPAGARHEAGDLLQAGIDWTRVISLASALTQPADHSQPMVFKSVGTGAWDLAAARVALKSLGLGPSTSMNAA